MARMPSFLKVATTGFSGFVNACGALLRPNGKTLNRPVHHKKPGISIW